MSLFMPGEKALKWLFFAPVIAAAMLVFDFHVGARAVSDSLDLSPGARFDAGRFQQRHCPDRAAVGAMIAADCLRDNRIQPQRYGLSKTTRQLWSKRQERKKRWARVRNDAVLAYCAIWGCRVVAIVPNRFVPTS